LMSGWLQHSPGTDFVQPAIYVGFQ
jgi:hypothetical protein